MNKDALRLFFTVVLCFTLLKLKCSDNNEKYLKLFPKGKIKEFCLKYPDEYHVRSIGWVIGDLVNRKNYNSRKMGKFEKLAYESVTKNFYFLSGDSKSVLTHATYEIAENKELRLSFDETCEKTAKIIKMHSKLQEEAEKAKKEAKRRLIKRNNDMKQMKDALLLSKKEANLPGNEFWLVAKGEE